MPVPHNRVILRGRLGTAEVWSTSFAVMGDDITPLTVNDSQAELDDWAINIAGVTTSTNLSGLRIWMSTTATIDSVQTQFRTGNTLVLQSAEQLVSSFTGTGTQFQPFQSAAVISLLGNTPGARHRGRMYWPATGASMGSTHRLPGTAAAVSSFQTYWNAVRDESPVANLRLAVFSPTYDALTPVSQVKIGDVPDTQRRRRDNLLEAYSTGVIT